MSPLKTKKIRRIDPSRTGLLRRQFLKEMNKRFAELYSKIKEFVVDEDAFGLKERKPLVILANPQYQFATDPQKLQGFQQWLQQQINAVILVVSGAGVPGQPWTYQYVDRAFKQGVGRAFASMSPEALAETPEWYRGTREQFLRSAFSQPIAMQKVELLSTRAFEQLKGVTATMSQQMSRILSMGLISGQGPLKIAREMQKSIAGLSKTRARMIARTEIIHAHAEGQLYSFELLGVKELGIIAEWSTAGDSLVCPICGDMEGETFSVEDAHGLIPAHPNCRCVWIPSEQQI